MSAPSKLGFSCAEYLSEIAKKDDSIWVLDGDLADSEGAELFFQSHPNKAVNAGIAEQNMVSMAAGLSAIKMRPWVFSFAAFLCYRAYDQIRVCISQTKLPVILWGSHAGGCGVRNGKTHLALNDITIMSSLPEIDIFAPSDEIDVKRSIDNVMKNNRPTYLRCPKEPLSLLPQGNGLVRWIGAPSEVAIISYGISSHWAMEVKKLLAKRGVDVGILHFCKIFPLDPTELNIILKGVQHAFVLEDHYENIGMVLHLKNIIKDINFISIGWPSDWAGQSGATSDLLEHCHLSPSNIMFKILTFIENNKSAYVVNYHTMV